MKDIPLLVAVVSQAWLTVFLFSFLMPAPALDGI